MDYEIVFESERIYFVRLTEKLVNDYLDMVNDIEVQKYISHKRRTYTLEGELEWIKDKLKNNDIFNTNKEDIYYEEKYSSINYFIFVYRYRMQFI